MNLISVVVASYNSEKTLDACLRAITNIVLEIELIVIDDCSQDSSVEISKKYTNKVFVNEVNKGGAFSRKRGMEESSGKYIVFIDSDIVIFEDSIDIIAKHFDANPEVMAITGRLTSETPIKNFWSRHKNYYMSYIFNSKSIQKVTYLYGSICAVRKGGPYWPERKLHASDTEYGKILVNAGHLIHFLPQLEVSHLKKYSFWGLLHNDFQIAHDFSRLFWVYHGWREFFAKRAVSHTSWTQLVSLPIVFLMFPLLYIKVALFGCAFVIWFLLNHRLLFFFIKKMGPFWGLLSMWTYLIENLFMGIGVVAGTFSRR